MTRWGQWVLDFARTTLVRPCLVCAGQHAASNAKRARRDQWRSPPKSQGNRMLNAQQLMWTQIAAGIAVLLFGLTLFNLIRMRGRMVAARSWDKVEGIITVSRVDQPTAHTSDDRNDAKPI